MRKRTRIYGRRAPKIQLCPTCGPMRYWHPDRKLYDCPVPQAVTDAVADFARRNGKRWKSFLKYLWAKNSNILEKELWQAKELIGPVRLYKIKVKL